MRLAEYAEKKRVTIGIENVWNKFLLSPMEMRDFIDRIGSRRVAAYFDVGNVVRDGYPEPMDPDSGTSDRKGPF